MPVLGPQGPQSTIGFIGAGAVGGTLAVALGQAGYRVMAVASRTMASAQGLAQRLGGCTAYPLPQQVVDACELVFISTPDDVIGQAAILILAWPWIRTCAWRSTALKVGLPLTTRSPRCPGP